MKHDWEYKKFTDICGVQYGYPFDSAYFNEDGEGLPLVRIRDVVRGYSETYFKGDFPQDYLVQRGDYLIGMDGEFNIAQWRGEDALLNQRVCRVSVIDSRLNEMQYVYYFLIGKLKEIEDETPFVTVKHLSAKRINQITIPVPGREEQEKIVAELDKVSEIIEKKKQQVKELDNLAQSIFYDMFGDPVENEKGWKFETIKDCFTYIKNGANIKQDKEPVGYPITRIETLSNGVFNRDRLGYAGIVELGKYSENVLQDNDLLMSHINSKRYIGRTVLYRKQGDETIIHGMNLLRLIPNKDLLSVFFCYTTKTDYFCRKIAAIRKDAVNQSSFAISDLMKIMIPLPPIELQEEFAKKIEAIEREKGLIGESIKESERLFEARMDYWFGE